MDRYWLKIGLGALAVFAVGLVAWRLVEKGATQVRELAGSDRAISIPLFGIVPFNIEGRRSGSIQRLTILRDAPKRISGVVVRVEGIEGLDSLLGSELEGCHFTVTDPTKLDENTQFRCLKGDSALAGFEGFGEVRIDTKSGTLVRKIYLRPEVIREFRDSAHYEAHMSEVEAREAEADRIADSIEAALEGLGDSISATVEAQVESIRADAIRRSAEAARRSAGAQVTAPPAAPPKP